MAALLAAPILLSLTLLVSGLAKLGERRATEDAMVSLRIPAPKLHRTAASVLPVAEIVLALALWIPVVPLQVVVACLIAALVLAYLVIIARALTFEEQVECSCFGSLASPTVSRATLGRNILLALAALTTVLAASAGLLTAVLVQAPLTLVGLGLALVLTVLLTVLTLGGTEAGSVRAADTATAEPTAAPSEGADEEELLDYERTVTPAAVLQKADGSLTTLRKLTYRRAALLLFVTDGCGPCVRVLSQGERWRREIGELIDVRFVFSRSAEHLTPRTAELAGDSVLHDLQFIARDALGGTSSPSAVLLGADGLLAGGPVTGGDAVIEFVDEIVAQIAEAQDDGELARPAE